MHQGMTTTSRHFVHGGGRVGHGHHQNNDHDHEGGEGGHANNNRLRDWPSHLKAGPSLLRPQFTLAHAHAHAGGNYVGKDSWWTRGGFYVS